ncbi:MAG: GIY-YIG nuclease family protein [Desulfuromonadales bacterium]|jgi:putative endonuclease
MENTSFNDAPAASPPANWRVYIILCSDNSLYTGITTDMERRFQQHLTGRGARYFRGRQPVRVVYFEEGHSRSSAARREVRIKSMKRAEKDLLISRTRP